MKTIVISLLVLLTIAGRGLAKDQIIVYGDSSEPPKSYIANSGLPAGTIVDVVRFISEHSGLNLKIVLVPWKRAYTNAVNGKGLVMSLSKTLERQKIFDYTEAIFYDDIVLVTHSNRIPKFSTYEDLRGKRLALNLGSSYGEQFDRALKEGGIMAVRSGNRKGWYRMLLRGRVDGVVAAQGLAGVHSILRSDENLWKRRAEFQILDRQIKRDPNYIGVPKSLSTPSLLAQLNSAIAAYWKQARTNNNH